jgi:hypothetical protein
MKKAHSFPPGEDLRHAIAWLTEQPRRDRPTIEEASRRFNLSPLDESLLLSTFGIQTMANRSRERVGAAIQATDERSGYGT